MMTSTRLRHRDSLPGHWTDEPAEPRFSTASVAGLLVVGITGCLTAVQLVLQLYPLQ